MPRIRVLGMRGKTRGVRAIVRSAFDATCRRRECPGKSCLESRSQNRHESPRVLALEAPHCLQKILHLMFQLVMTGARKQKQGVCLQRLSAKIVSTCTLKVPSCGKCIEETRSNLRLPRAIISFSLLHRGPPPGHNRCVTYERLGKWLEHSRDDTCQVSSALCGR